MQFVGQCRVRTDLLAKRRKLDFDRIVSARNLLHSSFSLCPASSSPPTPIFLRPDFYLLMTLLPHLLLPAAFHIYCCPLKHRHKSTAPSRTQIWLLMNLQIVSHVPAHFICFPGNIAIGPFENTLRGRDSPSLDRRVLHKAEVGMTDHLRMNCFYPPPFFLSSTATLLAPLGALIVSPFRDPVHPPPPPPTFSFDCSNLFIMA